MNLRGSEPNVHGGPSDYLAGLDGDTDVSSEECQPANAAAPHPDEDPPPPLHGWIPLVYVAGDKAAALDDERGGSVR